MKYLITGGCGFVGSNVAARLVKLGEEPIVYDSLGRHGSVDNLGWLRSLGNLEYIHGDIRNANNVDGLLARVQPDVIFHLAGQVAMTISMNDPRRDFEINVLGSLNLLEGVRRRCPTATVIYSSSNKVYGELEGVELREEVLRYSARDFPAGIAETARLDFQTPYGCSKGAADQYMLDYARVFGLNTVVFRHSTIFGGRQFATFDQGWVGWFCRQALEVRANPCREPFTISGDGKQVRDLLFIDDAVDCYLAAAGQVGQTRGQAFNVGGGIANSCSLLELFKMLEGELGVDLRYHRLPWRHSDQKFFVADHSKATAIFGWRPRVDKASGVRQMLAWAEQTMVAEVA